MEHQRYDINVLIVGGVSTGKSTFINSLFIDQFSEMKIKRTTMIPQIYHETKDINAVLNANEIMDNNKKINEKFNNNAEINSSDPLTELEYFVPRIHDFVNLHNNVYLNFYDTPGLNDSKTKKIYYEYIEKNLHKFDIIIFMIDINNALNTSDETEILELILKGIEHNESEGKTNELIILVNKCDDMHLDNKILVQDKEHTELMEQIMQISSHFIHKIHPTLIYKILPISCENAFIYRMFNKNNNIDIGQKYLDKLGYDICGKNKWLKLSDIERKYKVKKYMSKGTNEEIQRTGFPQLKNYLESVLDANKQYDFLMNKIKHESNIILTNKVKYETDQNNASHKFMTAPFITQLYELFKETNRIGKMLSVNTKNCVIEFVEHIISNYALINKNELINTTDMKHIKEILIMITNLFSDVQLNKCQQEIVKLEKKLADYYKDEIKSCMVIEDALNNLDNLISNTNDRTIWISCLNNIILDKRYLVINNEYLDTFYGFSDKEFIKYLYHIASKYRLTTEDSIDITYNKMRDIYTKHNNVKYKRYTDFYDFSPVELVQNLQNIASRYKLSAEESADIAYNLLLNMYKNLANNHYTKYCSDLHLASYSFGAKSHWNEYKTHNVNLAYKKRNIEFWSSRFYESVKTTDSNDFISYNLYLENYLCKQWSKCE